MSDALQPPRILDNAALLRRLSANGPMALSLQHVPAVFGRHYMHQEAEEAQGVLQARVDPRTERAIAKQPGQVAIVRVRGVIVPREDEMSRWFGEVGAEDTVRRVRMCVEDKDIKSVILDFDSPGGNVAGVEEAVAALKSLQGKKPIVAHADYVMASAAYWLACGANEINASPSAMVGWVGVITVTEDLQEFYKQLGVKFTKFSKPDDKGDGYGLWPNSERFATDTQEMIDETYAVYNRTVQEARGVDAKTIQDVWGAAGYNAPRAKLLGMIDKVRPMPETIGAYTTPIGLPGQTQGARNKLALLKLKKGAS